jgi:hypothetical protein
MWAAVVGLAAAAMLSASASGELTFPAAEAPLPACPSSQPLRLILSDLELPRNRAMTIRAYAKTAGAEPVYVGLLALMSESADAQGNRKVPETRITATPPFRQWLAAAETGKKGLVSVILRPYAGKVAMKDLIWSVRSVRWVCRQ